MIVYNLRMVSTSGTEYTCRVREADMDKDRVLDLFQTATHLYGEDFPPLYPSEIRELYFEQVED